MKKIILVACLLGAVSCIQAKQIAFPGAEIGRAHV